MRWYVVDAVDRAYARTKKCLFEPFDFWKWMKLVIIVMLIGGSGGNYNGGNGGGGGGDGYSSNDYTLPDLGPTDSFAEAFAGIGDLIPTSAPNLGLIIAIIVFIFALILFFTYVSSVMEFVFVDSLVSNEVKFWEYSRKYLRKGLGLFTFRLLYGIILLIIIAIMALPLILPLISSSGENIAETIGMAILSTIFLLVGIILLVAIIGSIISSFINLSIPVAIYTDTGIFRAFANVFGQFRKDWKQIFAYWFGRILLGIGIAIVVGILLLIVIIAVGLFLLFADLLFYFILSTVLPGSYLAIGIILVPIILIELVFLIFLIAFIALPARVFMKYHMLSFLQQWYPEVEIPVFDVQQINEEEEGEEEESDREG
ncbi:hypothetical protein SAMN04488587_1619 [Methanococcoides vulcani]|uniref:Membrane domain of glycerophosphoryl diester phosphodiesterase n=1 Tax=Methanococcoides vulcani TaxID=1353158 RepID=A0A1I0AET0_9EURY|nr:hypothetical protein [Methanococcoides vulcani]SES92705.1 hypothetical protein SAMN04488587_1619 [Methanococcoides vulcani]